VQGDPQHQPIEVDADKTAQQESQEPRLARYFRAMIKHNASDLHLHPGKVPCFRVRTSIVQSKAQPLAAEELHELAYELLNGKQRLFYEEYGSIDVAFELENSDRFRVDIYRQRGHTALAVRRVLREIPTFADLALPPILGEMAREQHGLILLSGGSGSGKSTTIAAMIEHVNRTRPCHIVTLEDPIEYLFEDKKAIVSQREIGIDCDNFETGLKYLMREDPDVVLIGEMRDHETFTAALQAAETGHLVFGTVHASSASQTIGRVLDLVGSENRTLFRQSLAYNLRGIICQILLPSVAEGVDRVPALEILRTNASVRQLIEENRELELPDVIRAGGQAGMQTFTSSLIDLIDRDMIDPRIAYEVAPNAEELKMHMKGISANQGGLLGRG
jgi:twitching motility protein PilT